MGGGEKGVGEGGEGKGGKGAGSSPLSFHKVVPTMRCLSSSQPLLSW